MEDLTALEIERLDRLNRHTQEMEFGQKVQDIIDAVNDNIKTGTPVNAVNASMVLTVSGVVIDGETVSIGDDDYEFTAGRVPAAGNLGVDIESDTTKSSGTLTVDTQPSSGDTMTIGSKEYTFVPVGTANADGEISVGADLAGAQAAIVAAINGSDSINTAHTLVTAAAFAANDCVVTAIIGGTAGDAIASTETFTAGTNVFAAATLGSGADCTAANAITALVSAITSDDTQGVGAADGAGDTVDLTVDVAGVLGNAVVIAETMANGSFAAAAVLMAGGVDATVGLMDDALIDDSYLYRCIADNAVSGKNWRRISLGSAY